MQQDLSKEISTWFLPQLHSESILPDGKTAGQKAHATLVSLLKKEKPVPKVPPRKNKPDL